MAADETGSAGDEDAPAHACNRRHSPIVNQFVFESRENRTNRSNFHVLNWTGRFELVAMGLGYAKSCLAYWTQHSLHFAH